MQKKKKKKKCLITYFRNILLKLKTQNWVFGMGIFYIEKVSKTQT